MNLRGVGSSPKVEIRTKDGLKTILGLHVYPTPQPIEVINEFTLDDKGFSQYVGLFLALWVAGLTLYVFVLCARMKIGRKKWFLAGRNSDRHLSAFP